MWRRLLLAFVALAAVVPVVLALSGCDALFGLEEIPPQCLLADEPADKNNAYECVCNCTVPQSMPEQRLMDKSDDAEQHVSTGAMLLNGLNLELGSSGTAQKVGVRFPGVGIEKGATIKNAQLKFWVGTASTNASVLQIRGQNSGNALPFTTATNDITARPLTSSNSVVTWNVPPWPTVGVSGDDQTSPNLAPILGEIIGHPDWRPGNALAFVIEGSGSRPAVSFDGNPARSPVLLVTYEVNQTVLNDLFVCMPEDLNPNRGGSNLTDDQIAQGIVTDCQERVGATVSAIAGACGYPSPCTCTATPSSQKLVCGCNDDCVGDVLNDDCSDFNPPNDVTATNTAGTTAVCTTHSPLASALYGQRSRCEVTGQATVTVDGKTPDDPPSATGVIDFQASLCPGASCAVGMEFALDVGDVTFSNFWGSRTFTDLASVGESLPAQGAVLDANGLGQFARGATVSTGRGRRDDQVKSVVTPNQDVINVEVGWGAATCRVHGALVGTVDPEAKRCQNNANVACTTDADCPGDCTEAGTCPCVPIESAALTLGLDVSGSIVNQPPTANAGADQNAECNLTGAGRFVLDGSASSDPDGNIADHRWFLGDRAGPVAGFGEFAMVEQAIGTQVAYVLRVVDARGQSDEDTTSVQVVDTKPPEVSCNTPTPNTITPPRAPLSFQAKAVDACDPQVTPTLSNAKCFSINTGTTVDPTSDDASCRVRLNGDTITILNAGGVGDHVTWTASATDDSGNRTDTNCEIEVVAPPPR